MTGLTAVVTGLSPALRFRTPDASNLLPAGTRTSPDRRVTRVRGWLIGAQVALTLVLLVAATLLLRSFVLLRAADLGFRPQHVLTAELQVPVGRFVERRPWYRLADHYDRMIAELSAVPGVRSVAGVTNVPLAGERFAGSLWRTDAAGAEGRRPPTSATDQWKAAVQMVTPRSFETLGVPVLRGRAFTESERSCFSPWRRPPLSSRAAARRASMPSPRSVASDAASPPILARPPYARPLQHCCTSCQR